MAVESSRASDSRIARLLGAIALVVALAALAVGLTSGGSSDGNVAADLVAKADTSRYQAVTLTSGAVYYGKLSHDGRALVLKDVYYLTGATTDNPSGSLVKRGAEVHAPTGDMVLNSANVVEVDNVGANSIVARGITRIRTDGASGTTTSTTAAPTTTTSGG